ncbi:hypothetical protein KC19_1G200700, partial [Ceratodon purpureus]
ISHVVYGAVLEVVIQIPVSTHCPGSTSLVCVHNSASRLAVVEVPLQTLCPTKSGVVENFQAFVIGLIWITILIAR